MKTSLFILLVAGKSGGHLVPGLTYMQQLKQENEKIGVITLTTNSPLDAAIIAQSSSVDKHVGLPFDAVPQTFWHILPTCLHFIGSFFKSCYYLLYYKPIRVVSMSGAVSLPVCLAAWMLRIPIELWELNAVPGRAALRLAFFATSIKVCFAQAQHSFDTSKTHLVNYPLRFSKSQLLSRSQACNALERDPNKKILLVLGGSQGSSFINALMQEFVRTYPSVSRELVIIHQTGANQSADIERSYQEQGIDALVFDFKDDLSACYAAADLVIARAGAGTLFELVLFNKKSILIPLVTSSTAHQTDNAAAMQELHPELFRVIQQQSIEQSPAAFFKQLLSALSSYDTASMSGIASGSFVEVGNPVN